jgi:oxygen-independent coproporphyrinogen-3 oxidase
VNGLYIHVPFCSQRCVYCNFYFTTTSRDVDRYVRALAVEIEAYAAEYAARGPLRTLYFGGGTPSLLPLSALARILDTVHRGFDTSALDEVTLEANPEDLAAPGAASALRALGITRLSLGVQSFFEDDLRFMNRAHSAAQAEAAVRAAAEAFETFSVDLIFGVPEQPLEVWGANLEKAVRLGAPHLSAYSLTVEPHTPLGKQAARGLVVPEGDDLLRERFLMTHAFLEARGFEHYEVSSFARPGHRGRHNEGYWTHANALAAGPSAHGFWRQSTGMAVRWANVANLRLWTELLEQGRLPVDRREAMGLDELADEAVLLRLRRLVDGLDLDRLEADYGLDLLAERADVLAALEGAGLLTTDTRRVRLTPEGAVIADAVALRLVA